MARREQYFAHPSQLHALTPLLVPRSDAVIRLGGVMAEHPQRASWERDLNKSYHACGCDTGAAGMLAGSILGVALAIAMIVFSQTWIAAIGVALGASFAGATTGKMIGVIAARRRLKGIVRGIEREWSGGL